MKYHINAKIKETDRNIIVYNEKKALKLDKAYKNAIKEVFSFFTFSREKNELLVYASTSDVIEDIIQSFMKEGFLRTEKESYIQFNSIKIITSVSAQGKILNLVNRYIIGMTVEEIIVKRIDELEGKSFEDDFVVLYIPDDVKLLRDILNNYAQYSINKILIGIVWFEYLYYTFLMPPATACPKCFIEALAECSNVFNYISESEGKISNDNDNLIKKVLAPAIIVNSIDRIKSLEDDNISPTIIGHLNIFNFKNSDYKTEYIIKRYDCDCLNMDMLVLEKDVLVGETVGLIKRIRIDLLDQTFPPCVFLKATLPKSNKMVGALDFSWENAYIRTIGEFVERYCWENYSKDLFVTRWDNIPKEKQIPLERINRYMDWQYEKNHNIKKLSEYGMISWVNVYNMLDKVEKCVPAEFIVNNKVLSKDYLHYVSSTGVAAGIEDFDNILEKAFFELIERDTITRNIYTNEGISEIKDTFVEENYYTTLCRSYGLNAGFYYFSNDYGIPVVMCRLEPEDKSDSVISYGYACDENEMKCIIKSLKEALLMRRAIIQDFKANKSKSRFACTMRGARSSFFENIVLDSDVSINDIKKKKLNNNRLDQLKQETYFADITLPNLREMGWLVISVYNPGMLDFAINKDMLMLKNVHKDYDQLNSGFMQF